MNQGHRWGLAAIVLSIFIGTARADEPIKVSGKISIGTHEVNLKEGTIYLFKVEGVDFRPQVNIEPGFLNPLNFSFDANKPVEAYYYADRNQIHTVYIIPQTFGLAGNKGPFEYKLTVTPVVPSPNPVLKMDDTLANTDPAYKNQFITKTNHKSYPLKLAAGQFYIIDMIRRGDNRLDCYLYLEDGDGKIVASNDDGAGNLNSRIVYLPQKEGMHRIIATNLGDALGDFTVTVRSQQKD